MGAGSVAKESLEVKLRRIGGPALRKSGRTLEKTYEFGLSLVCILINEKSTRKDSMLTEQFIAAIGVPEKPPATNVARDAAIFPTSQQRALFKKSATASNCLAFSDSHIFAAQLNKAVVHVYNREKGNQEATVPFTEQITCVSLACDDTVLVLGTAEGRIFLWETCTGRQLTTSQAHLQAVTVVVVDSTSNFLLSASADSTVHVWSIPGLLSFANVGTQGLSPLRTFTPHRAEITALAIGHSASFNNFAVSVSKDQICTIWDFHKNTVFRTYLLPSVPTCVTLDAADRALYIGYEDGSVQQIDLHTVGTTAAAPTGMNALQNGDETVTPIQPSLSLKWNSPDVLHGAILSISLSFDSCKLLSGHQSGAVVAWDVASGRVQANVLQIPLPGPVTNLSFLPAIGFARKTGRELNVATVVKPRFGAFDSGDGNVPGNYAVNFELPSNLTSESSARSAFEEALLAPFFPQSLLDSGLDELTSWANRPSRQEIEADNAEPDDFMALDGQPDKIRELTLDEQNAALKAQLSSMRRLQTASFDKLEAFNAERKALLKREHLRMKTRGGTTNGTSGNAVPDEDESMDDSDRN
ncbi:Pre-rRNA-processing protein ipi3 [Friedmanniomyces endolithicus]|uniref:Pre-rRNA-processing protein IPI3 n=1 Tax=Friedmanniomyces endolithicus TaxID=329885 RepID=A0AAN6FED0_9PEZI|nr:Pre-rRNA-processing protein ipi3 [Friedmanniomyces endolithicus]